MNHAFSKSALRGALGVLLALAGALLAGCPPTPAGPTAQFMAVATAGAAPFEVAFVDQSQPGDSPITTWQWGFGDGTTSSQQNPAHTYDTPGTYTVSLEVTTELGSSVESKKDYIAVTLPKVVINEFVAANSSGLEDEDGDTEDWIELYNPGDTAVSLAGWSLTDTANEPAQWIFPDITLDAYSYLVVFASGKDRRSTDGSNLHTNFSLNRSEEFLVLYDAEGQFVSGFSPIYPEQLTGYSYGRYGSGMVYRYFESPTPGQGNTGGNAYLGVAAPPTFSAQRGFYDASFDLTLSSPIKGATIHYTLDGSDPTPTAKTAFSAPLAINTSAVVRALTYHPDYITSSIATHTYLVGQDDAVESLPALSLVGDEGETFYEPNGVMAIVGGHYEPEGGEAAQWVADTEDDYNNPMQRGSDYERLVSAEYILPGDNSGFQIECGLRVHGSDALRSRFRRGDDWSVFFYKFSFRLHFREDYGAAKLDYPLFGDSDVDKFETLIIRGGHGDPYDPFIKDEMARRLYGDMGHVTARGAFVNLFINGIYKGYFNITERPDEDFFQAWFDSDEQWDMIDQSGAVEGDEDAWNLLLGIGISQDPSDDAVYEDMTDRLRIKTFIDYLILELYSANTDWPSNNWITARERKAGEKFIMFVWDVENGFRDGYLDGNGLYEFPNWFEGGGAGLNGELTPLGVLYRALKQNAQFRTLFSERIDQHFFEDGGAMSQDNLTARFEELHAIMAGVLPDMETYIRDTWIPQRQDIFLNQLIDEGLYIPAKWRR